MPWNSPAQPTGAPLQQPAHTADPGVWPQVVRDLADDLAVDASGRDRAGKPPFDEVARLREAGLPPFLTPPGPHGPGADWHTACAAVREVAAADSSVAELLARHYVLAWSPRFFGTPEHAARLEAQSVRGQWLWAGTTDAAPASAGAGLLLSPRGKKYVLNGHRTVSAGATVADRLVLPATHTDTGETVIVLVDPARAAVTAEAAEERLGQRLTGAGTVSCDDVPVPAAQVLGTVPGDEHSVPPFTALAPLALRLILLHVGLGNAEGALAEAREVSRSTPGTPSAAGPGMDDYPSAPGADPYLLLSYGQLATAAHSAASVVDRATDALARGLLAGPGLGAEDHGDIAFLVAAAEAVTTESALHITTRILELTADAHLLAPAADPGFDRFWRNARALTAKSSATHRLRDIGDHYLNGPHPPLTLRA